MLTAPSTTPLTPAAAPRVTWSPRAVLLYFGALALAHVIVRVSVSSGLKWDEAEQMLWSQQFAWGYGAQPPLYTWLQRAANAVFGPSVLALSVLKHTLLALTYVFMWLAARRVLPPRAAWWAAASMVLLPALGWTSVRDQTHTVLVTCLVAATWWAVLTQLQAPRPAGFAWIGLLAGLGMLAKYNYALFAAALGLAALSVPQGRAALLSRGWWLVPLVAALVLLPHALWLQAHLQDASAETLRKMEVGARSSALKGVRDLFKELAATLLLWTLAAGACLGRAWPRAERASPDNRWLITVFVRYVLLCGAALLTLILLAGMSEIKERWLLPLLCAVPMMVLAARPGLAAAPGGRVFSALIVGTAALVLVAASARAWVTASSGQTDELNHAVPELAAALQAAGYDGRGRVIAADHMLAGMLRTGFPHAHAAACETRVEPVAPCIAAQVRQARADGRGWLLVSRADRLEPGWWDQARAALPTSEAPQSLRLPFQHVPAGTAPAHYQFIWHTAGTP